MTGRELVSWLATAAAAIVLCASPARANSGVKLCIEGSRDEFQDCNAGCTDDYQSAKDACSNRDHQCVDACRVEREDCETATGLDAALGSCANQLAQAKQKCRQNNPPGDNRDQCIEQVEVVGFECRAAARKAARPALRQCRKGFMSCAHSCPPASPPSPSNVKQCRQGAQDDFKTCKADCKETYQVEKDACRHRSHACVEQCRSNRDACEAPIESQLATAIGACNATRATAIANCKQTYPDGSPAQEQCIENAQVADFICRDAARDVARPGLIACGNTFLQCAKSCGPASPSGAFLDGGSGF